MGVTNSRTPDRSGFFCGDKGSTIIFATIVPEDRDPAQREAEGPRASMDYSEFTLLLPAPPFCNLKLPSINMV